MNDEGEILLLLQYLVEEAVAGVAFVRQHASHTAAGVDKQPDGQRKVALLREIFNGLRTAFLVELEVVFCEVANNVVLLIAYRGEKVDHLYIGGKAGFLLLLSAQIPGRRQT